MAVSGTSIRVNGDLITSSIPANPVVFYTFSSSIVSGLDKYILRDGYTFAGWHCITDGKNYPVNVLCSTLVAIGATNNSVVDLETIFLPEVCTISTQTIVDIANKIRNRFYDDMNSTLLDPDQFVQYIGKKISFTIDGTTYYAVDGMTWGEWVDTHFNTGGFEIYIDGNVVTSGINPLTYNGSHIPSSELISINRIYGVESGALPPV